MMPEKVKSAAVALISIALDYREAWDCNTLSHQARIFLYMPTAKDGTKEIQS